MLVSTIFLAALILMLLLIKQKWKPVVTSSKNLPPAPKKLPIIGNLHQLGDAPHRSLQSLAEKYGPLMMLQLGSVPTLVVSSADAAREIFKNHDIAFSNRPVLYAANKFSYNCSDIAFSPYGDYWRELRKIANLELLSPKRVLSFQGIRKEEVSSMIEAIAGSANNPVNLSDLTLLLSTSVILWVAFGKKEKKDENEFRKGKSEFQEILNETMSLFGGFCVSDFFPWLEWLNKFNGLGAKVERNFRKLDKFYDEVLEEHLDPNRPHDDEDEDIIDVLLRLQKDQTLPIAIKDHHIKGVLTDIFLAGTDTSAVTLVWIMTELIKNPPLMKKAQSEVRELACGKSTIEESDIPQLNYLKLVIKEGLRLHPPAPLFLPRETIEMCTIGGYTIPEKTRVYVNGKAIAMDPKRWEKPEEFMPERFLDGTIDFKGQNFEFLPFGVGRRICPGINFAMPMVELALANLLYRFNWSLPEGMKEEDIDMGETFGTTTHKKIPLCLVATPAAC